MPSSGISYLPTPPELWNMVPRGVLPTAVPPQNYGTWYQESTELQRESNKIVRKFAHARALHGRAREGTYPSRITERGGTVTRGVR